MILLNFGLITFQMISDYNIQIVPSVLSSSQHLVPHMKNVTNALADFILTLGSPLCQKAVNWRFLVRHTGHCHTPNSLWLAGHTGWPHLSGKPARLAIPQF